MIGPEDRKRKQQQQTYTVEDIRSSVQPYTGLNRVNKTLNIKQNISEQHKHKAKRRAEQISQNYKKKLAY